MTITITITAEPTTFPLAEVFTIARGSRTEAKTVTVTISDGTHQGRGECVPYARYNETVESVLAQIDQCKATDRHALQHALGAGAARNALDCAFWDLEAKRSGKRVWELAGIPEPAPAITAYTLSLAAPDAMKTAAAKHAHRPLLKIKLGGEGDMARLEAVRAGAPDTPVIIDANEGWDADEYTALAPALLRLGVKMVEQPLPAGDDDLLAEIDRPLPVCADEACHDRSSLPALAGKYDMVNIKLDKTGGLSEALALRNAAVEAGYALMVGCMVGSSLAMAPATLLTTGAAYTDLDGPLLLAQDRTHPLHFDQKGVHPPVRQLWG